MQISQLFVRRTLTPLLLLGLMSCTTPSATTDDAGSTDETASANADEVGLLAVRANGEDFVRQGFTAKDGWAIAFDHVYVHVEAVTAYQTEPAYQPESDEPLNAIAETELVAAQTVDLAEGDADAEPILLAEVEAPAGRYNALSWQMTKASEGPAAGHVLVLIGTAEKAGETINFTLKLDPELSYTCGDYVGDARKGILEPEGEADLEATFHFDHIFGDGEAPPEDDINTGALGFEPLAALATDGTLEIDQATLEAELTPEEYATLEDTLTSLGHVGEGHCREENS